jgi:hypothetical protein
MKIRITKRVNDKITREVLVPQTVIERESKRANEFIDAGVAEEVKVSGVVEPAISKMETTEKPKKKRARKKK